MIYDDTIFAVVLLANRGNYSEVKNCIIIVPSIAAAEMWGNNEVHSLFPLTEGYTNHLISIVGVTFGDIVNKLEQKYPDLRVYT